MIKKSTKLDDVCYDIRGPVLAAAERLEEEGHRVLKLNIGNPAPWGFDAPEEIIRDIIANLPAAQGYCDSKGIFSARKAVMQYCQQVGIKNVDVDDIYIGNGVSELVALSIQALLNNGDEVLIPSPDFPLWSAATNLSGGKAVHYLCDEEDDWQPDLQDLRSKITPATKAMVIINPNNPTGAVYSVERLQAMLQLARDNDLVVFADEIYDKILFDELPYTPIACWRQDAQWRFRYWPERRGQCHCRTAGR
tara:strand:- start:102 stop:851 length:750 start_codon:yes stop_codon:yes gene_type:complete